MSSQDARKALVRQLARQTLTATAPGQLPSFDKRADDYFTDPDSARPSTGRSNEPTAMAFETVAALTAALLNIADKIVEHIHDEATKKTRTKAKGRWPFSQRATPNEDPELVTLPQLTPDQIQTVRALAAQEAAAWGLSQARSAEVADAMVRAVATQTQPALVKQTSDKRRSRPSPGSHRRS
jgi:hypothetical protein